MRVGTAVGAGAIGNLILVLLFTVPWVMNIYKLTQCDFEPSYKTEIIRVVGIVTPISCVTGWMDIGEENVKKQ